MPCVSCREEPVVNQIRGLCQACLSPTLSMMFNEDCIDAMRRLKSWGIRVDLTVCDPPWGVNFQNSKTFNDRFNVASQATEWLELVYDLHRENTYIFLYVGSKTIHHWINAMEASGFTYIDTIAAHTYTNGNHNKKGFDNSFQPIIYGVKGEKKVLNKVDYIPTSKSWLNDSRNNNKNPHTYNYPNFISRDICSANVKANTQRKLLHPNEKNVDLLKFLIGLSSAPNGVVLDFAMGSGSTCVAAKQCGRGYIGIELNSDYYETAKKRLEE